MIKYLKPWTDCNLSVFKGDYEKFKISRFELLRSYCFMIVFMVKTCSLLYVCRPTFFKVPWSQNSVCPSYYSFTINSFYKHISLNNDTEVLQYILHPSKLDGTRRSHKKFPSSNLLCSLAVQSCPVICDSLWSQFWLWLNYLFAKFLIEDKSKNLILF